MDKICACCDAEILAGISAHEVRMNGVVEVWCLECTELISQMLWPEEWGSRGGLIISQAGNA